MTFALWTFRPRAWTFRPLGGRFAPLRIQYFFIVCACMIIDVRISLLFRVLFFHMGHIAGVLIYFPLLQSLNLQKT